jgi:hypothetical protein
MALTNQGLVIRRFPEVQAAIQTAILQTVSSDVIFDEDTLMAQIVNIVSAEISSLEEVVQSVYDSLDRDKAEGSSLDSLLYLIGLQRVGQAYTSGKELFIGDDGTSIPQGTILSNPSTGDRFSTNTVGTLSQDSCVSCDYQVATVADSTTYTVTINGGDYNYTSGIGATQESIVQGLVTTLNTPTDKSWEASQLVSPPRLRVNSTSTLNISLNVLSSLLPERATNYVQVSALEYGPIKAPASSVTQLITAVGGVTSIINLTSFGVGRLRETDEDFRVRASQSLSLVGSSTVPAITAALLNLDDVSSAVVIENTAGVTVEGRPPKSYECIVTAPSTVAANNAIANAVWNDKPAGIELIGNTVVTITDSTGLKRDIYFSRPQGIPIAIKVTYTLYDEESFPFDGPTLIKNAVVAYGTSLDAGEDIIPKRFYGSIYSAVEGLGNIVVESQVLPSQGATPVEGSWSQVATPVTESDIASFNIGDVYTVEA